MIKIVVEHSKIIINDYDLGDCESLENFFSIFDPSTHTRFPFGMYYKQEERQLVIPRGVDISYIKNKFNCIPQLNKRHDPMDKIEPIKLRHPPRDNNQRETLRFMLGKSEYYYTTTKSMLAVNLAPGVGKTYCSIATSAFIGYRSIMLTSSLSWIEQWKQEILKYTDIKPREIFIIAGTPSIHSILKQGVHKFKFILASMDTIISYGQKYGFDKISELFVKLRVGIKYIDEAHLNFKAMMLIDFYTNTYKNYYLTGSPCRSSEDQDRIYKIYFKNVPSIDLFDETKDPHTDYLGMRYNSHPTAADISYCKNKYGLDRNKYTGDYIIRRPNFYNILRVIIDRTLAKNGKILFYIGVNRSIEVVKAWMEMYYPFLIGHIGIYTSTTSKDIKRSQLDKKYILSTTKSCGAAMDIKGLATTVILAEPFKSEPLAIQTLGRTRDDDTECIEAVDEGFNAIMRFYYQKQPIMKKYALSVNDVRYKDETLEDKINEIFDRYYGDGEFPVIYIDNKKIFMLRQELRPINEYDSKGRKVFMKRDKF